MKHFFVALIALIVLVVTHVENGYCEDWKHFYNGGDSQFFYDKGNVKTPKQTGSFYYETSLLKNNSLGSLVVGARIICTSKMITFGGIDRRYTVLNPQTYCHQILQNGMSGKNHMSQNIKH